MKVDRETHLRNNYELLFTGGCDNCDAETICQTQGVLNISPCCEICDDYYNKTFEERIDHCMDCEVSMRCKRSV